MEPQAQGPAEQFVVESSSSGLPWRLMIFSAVLFGFSIFVYFGVHFGYTKYLDDQSTQIEANLETLAKKINETDQEQFISFYSQIVNLKTVLDKHAFPSNFFTLLEKYVIAPVYFIESAVNADERTVAVRGVASSFDALAQQMGVLERAPEVVEVFLGGVTLQANGGIGFEMTVEVRPEYLSKPAL